MSKSLRELLEARRKAEKAIGLYLSDEFDKTNRSLWDALVARLEPEEKAPEGFRVLDSTDPDRWHCTVPMNNEHRQCHEQAVWRCTEPGFTHAGRCLAHRDVPIGGRVETKANEAAVGGRDISDVLSYCDDTPNGYWFNTQHSAIAAAIRALQKRAEDAEKAANRWENQELAVSEMLRDAKRDLSDLRKRCEVTEGDKCRIKWLAKNIDNLYAMLSLTPAEALRTTLKVARRVAGLEAKQ